MLGFAAGFAVQQAILIAVAVTGLFVDPVGILVLRWFAYHGAFQIVLANLVPLIPHVLLGWFLSSCLRAFSAGLCSFALVSALFSAGILLTH